MAEIDKALPNVKQTVNVPSPQDIEIAEQEKLVEQQEAGVPVETTENEDGSVDVNFEPKIDMRYNKYIEANSIFLNKMYSVALLRRFFSQTLPESVVSFIKNRFFTKKDKPLLNPKTKSLLYKIFNEETIQLEKLINKKFTSWKN